MNNFEHPQPDPHDIDLRTVHDGRLIYPSEADGANIHNLKLQGITIPVSFTVLPGGYFRMNGLQEGHSAGLVLSGFLFNTDAKINHVVVDEELRRYAKEHGNARVGEAALLDLEESLKKQGISTVYAVFYMPDTIEFFRRNGYKIASVASLMNDTKIHLGIRSEGFNKQITDDETFDQHRPTDSERYQHVLLKKHLS